MSKLFLCLLQSWANPVLNSIRANVIWKPHYLYPIFTKDSNISIFWWEFKYYFKKKTANLNWSWINLAQVNCFIIWYYQLITKFQLTFLVILFGLFWRIFLTFYKCYKNFRLAVIPVKQVMLKEMKYQIQFR